MRFSTQKKLVRTWQQVKPIATLNKGEWRWAIGLQAGIATGVVMGLFIWLDHPSLGAIASLGGLSVLYGTQKDTAKRLRLIFIVGSCLVFAALAGVLCAASNWLSFACLIVVTAVASIVTAGSRVGPPGPVMFVLVTAISTQLSITMKWPDGWPGIFSLPLLVGIGAYLSWIIVALFSLLPFFRSKTINIDSPGNIRTSYVNKDEMLVAARTVAGVAAAVLLSKPLGIVRIHWVIIAVTAILQAGFGRQLTTIRAFERVLGTILGVVFFHSIYFFEPSGTVVVLIIVLLQFGTQVVIARNYILGLFFITPMALLIATISHSGGAYITARERIVDTLIGASLAILVFWAEEIIRLKWWPFSRQGARSKQG